MRGAWWRAQRCCQQLLLVPPPLSPLLLLLQGAGGMKGTVDRYFLAMLNGKNNASLPAGARINPQLPMYAASGLIGSGPEGGEPAGAAAGVVGP